MKQVPHQQAAAPTFQAMRKVIKFAAEKEDRAKRLVFFGLEEREKEGDKVDPGAVVEALGLEPYFETTKILGVRNQGYNRTVLVTMDSTRHTEEILRKSHHLRQIEEYKSVFMSPDCTIELRKQHHQLVSHELAEKRPGDDNLRIVIRDGEVVSRRKQNIWKLYTMIFYYFRYTFLNSLN